MSHSCPLCAGGPDIPTFEKGGQRYVRCAQCGFRFGRSETNANLQTRIEDFEPAYRQYLDPTAVDEANHDATLAWIEARVPLGPGVLVLDVGAGSGKFLRHLAARRQCRTAGLEPSTELHGPFGLHGLGILNQTLPEFAAAYAGTGFDIVTVLDVIEHVQSPVQFTRSLHAITRPGGLVFLTTPDVGSLLARMLGRRWHHYNRYHFSLFDRRSMAALARQGGFEVLELSHRAKRFTLGYLRDYVRDFVLTRAKPAGTPHRQNLVFSLNTYDIMSVVWTRKP